MEKFLKIAAALSVSLAMVACSSNTAKEEPAESATTETTETTEAAEDVTGEYKIVNMTGEKLTELYVYDTGSADKGENYAGDGLADGDSVTVSKGTFKAEEAEGKAYTLEFKTESGYGSDAFQTLHVETVTMNLLPEADVTSAATPFEFAH